MKTKYCHCCEKEKPITEFYSNGYSPSGTKKYKPTCKPCECLIKNKRHRATIKDILKEQGREYKCEKCGYDKNYAALTFHHNTEEKNFEISNAKSRNRNDLDYEIYICDLLCQNCHHELHNPNSMKENG